MTKLIRYNDDFFDKVYEIHTECFLEEAMPEELFREELELDSRVYYIALDEGNPVGYAGAWNTGDDYSIISVAVKSKFRRKGIARQLLERLILDAKNKNIFSISLEVSELNKPAISLYRELGFITTNIRQNYYKNKVSALIMWLHM